MNSVNCCGEEVQEAAQLNRFLLKQLVLGQLDICMQKKEKNEIKGEREGRRKKRKLSFTLSKTHVKKSKD